MKKYKNKSKRLFFVQLPLRMMTMENLLKLLRRNLMGKKKNKIAKRKKNKRKTKLKNKQS